jgi:hypothetical protein
VTGFEGNVWWAGTVTGIVPKGAKLLYRVMFEADYSFADCPLSEKTYGPAEVTQSLEGMKVKPGWIYILPRSGSGESERHAAAAEEASSSSVIDI